jgi:pyruvate,water dikinase
VIKNLKEYLAQPDRDLEAELKAQVAEREQLSAQTRERLKGYPQAAINRFEMLLKAAQTAATLHEEHNYWIDQRCQYQMRRVVQEFGRRLVEAGVLDRPDDLFYLTVDEVRETAITLANPSKASLPGRGLDRRTLVRQRQAEMEHFRTIRAPSALGTTPLAEPPDDPFGRSFSKVMGKPLQPSTEHNVLYGYAGSPGVVRGRARVIGTLAEVDKLKRGDVLVTKAIMPPWTPLFATAAAVVTDVGSVLSHGAVVAHEYRIPAVVGTGTATALIRDGQILEVDGNTGLVRILDGQNGPA